MLTYMNRLLNVDLNLDKEAFEILYWMLNRDLANDYVKTIKELVPEHKRPKTMSQMSLLKTRGTLHRDLLTSSS